MATTTDGQKYNEDRERVAQLKSLGDVPGLVALAHDQSRHRHSRVRAIRALGKLGTPDAVEALIGFASASPDDERFTALAALARRGDPAAAPVMAGWLQDADENVVAWGVIGLGRARSRDAVPALIEVLHHPNWGLRRAAARALSEIGDPSAREPLRQLRRRERPTRRVFITRALWRL